MNPRNGSRTPDPIPSVETPVTGRAVKARGLRRLPLFRTRRRTIVTLLLSIPLLLCLVYWLLGIVAFADTASVVALKGIVQTRLEEEPRWLPAHLNQLLWRKHWVRTGDSSSARLLFFDISTVDLEANTEVSILRVAKRRGGGGVDVVLKMWIGKTLVRAVRFIDPSSTFRVETPTASTVVRGARFSVEVAEDGTTQVEIEEGTAQVETKGEVITLQMGERITVQPSGDYVTERVFHPDPRLVAARIEDAWSAPGSAFDLELPESEVNHFLAAMSEQPDSFLEGTQIWFTDDQIRVATTIVQPVRLDVSAAVDVHVVDGKLKPDLESVSAGIALPVPDPVLDLALETVLGQIDDYLAQAYDFVAFSDVQVKDGVLVVTGSKQADAPTQ